MSPQEEIATLRAELERMEARLARERELSGEAYTEGYRDGMNDWKPEDDDE